MGNLPFYIVEHARKKMPLTEWDTLFANAHFEFADIIESPTSVPEDSKRLAARQCSASDFANNNQTRTYYESNKNFIMLCPA